MVSFDIFDTLITRKTALPEGIFLLVQKKAVLPDNFVDMRVNAEKDARLYAAQVGKEEITLQDIYNILSNRLERELNDVMKLEIEIEINNVYPIWTRINQLKNFLNQKQRVVLISDMYLDVEVIREMLTKIDPVFQEIPIYVSGNYGKTKRSGALFREVLEIEKTDYDEWSHYGDNQYSDYLIPKMLGIHAECVEQQSLPTWERILGEKLGIEHNLLLQLYVGAFKIVREENDLNTPAQIGASLGNMILFPYVQWVLGQCVEKQIDRLYFVARDGYILKKIADVIIKNRKLDIFTKYIYGSRKAWRLEKTEIQKRDELVGYWRQEIDFSDEKYALVDLHGSGVTMEYLVDILEAQQIGRLKVFYFDLIENHPSEKYQFFSFCSEHSGMSELFCRAPHGATIGYDLEDGLYKPVMQPREEDSWRTAGIFDYADGVELAATRLSQLDENLIDSEICECSEAALNYCRFTPDNHVLRFLGDMPHCDGLDEENKVFAPVLNAKDIFRIYMWRTIESLDRVYQGSNLQMSLQRTEQKYIKQKEFWEKHYNTLLGKVIHRIKIGYIRFGHSPKKVVIYAAGRNGKALYAHLQAHPEFQVVAWTDMDAEKYEEYCCPIIACGEAIKRNYDYLIVSIDNPVQRESVKENLLSLGVEHDKIIFYGDFVQQFL